MELICVAIIQVCLKLRDGFKSPFPSNYYESSFQTISKTHAIDHLHYRFYWESYVRNSTAFMNEIEQVANAADKFDIKIVYDNHQFHTSYIVINSIASKVVIGLYGLPCIHPLHLSTVLSSPIQQSGNLAISASYHIRHQF